jgi:hypothetical protein
MVRPATRKARGLAPKEDQMQISIVGYLRRVWPAELPVWHCPNGGKREHKTRQTPDGKTVTYSPEAQKLAAMGALPGVPDLTFILPNGQAAFIELKVGDNDLSDDQIKFRDRVLALRCGYDVCRSLDEVEQVLTRWLSHFPGYALRGRMVERKAA